MLSLMAPPSPVGRCSAAGKAAWVGGLHWAKVLPLTSRTGLYRTPQPAHL